MRKLRADPFLAASASLPPLALGALWSLGLHGTAALGHWPRAIRDDPWYQTRALALHAAVTSALLNAALLSPLAVMGVLIARRLFASADRPSRTTLLVFAVLYAALWLQLVVDPGHLFEWLMD